MVVVHWLRMDRYFDGTDENPDSAIQPMACKHCENALRDSLSGGCKHGPEGTDVLTTVVSEPLLQTTARTRFVDSTVQPVANG